MGRVQGKVAFITGAARGQGRSHAVRLAAEGADIVAVDVCADLPTVPYDLGRDEDLAETAELVEKEGRACLTARADVRDLAALRAAVRAAMDRFGRLDVLVANAGILSFGRTWELPEETWSEMIGVNLDGVWKTIRAAVPAMIEAGHGGSVIVTSSNAGKRGLANLPHYSAAKHGVVGLCKTLAVEGAEYGIRANTVHPTTVGTRMALNDATYRVFFPGVEAPSKRRIDEGFQSLNLLPVPYIDPMDVSHAVVYLASDESRYVTGSQLYVDAGTTER